MNGYILTCEFGHRNSPKTLSHYTLPVVEKLMYMGNPPNPHPVPRQTHYLIKIPGTESRPQPSKCCKMCWKQVPTGKTSVRETRYQCALCENNPALNMECFDD